MIVRSEKAVDIKAIRKINIEAFGGEEEANIVDTVRTAGVPYIALVCEEEGELRGHILFSPVQLIGDTSGLRIMGLAPMAVVPSAQNKGIGTRLVKAGIALCKSEGYGAIAVLGHPAYYPRFGFEPAVNYGIISEHPVPEDVFMLLELKKDALKGKRGTIKYNKAFEMIE